MVSVIIADDHAIVRQGLRNIIADTPDIHLVAEAATGQEALQMLRGESCCDVLVLDINMPGLLGLDILAAAKQEQPQMPVLVLSIHSEDQYALRCLRAGASGYLTKDSAPEELVEAIRHVAAGGTYVSSHMAGVLAQRVQRPFEGPRYETLSDREFEVMCLMGTGRTPTEIAGDLSLSVKTVSTYRRRILDKLNLKSSAEIVHYAINNGLIAAES